MRVDTFRGQLFAQSFLAMSAISRIMNPHPHLSPLPNNPELQVVTDHGMSLTERQDAGQHLKLKLPLCRGRQRRPYIQFEDGSYQIL